MEWSKESVCHLIQLFQEKDMLWNSSSEQYKNKQLKSDAWAEIADNLKVEKAEAEKKMRGLIGQFQREERRTKPGEESRWFAYKHLTFLKDRNKIGKSRESAGIMIKRIYDEDDLVEYIDDEICEEANETDHEEELLGASIIAPQVSNNRTYKKNNHSMVNSGKRQRTLNNSDHNNMHSSLMSNLGVNTQSSNLSSSSTTVNNSSEVCGSSSSNVKDDCSIFGEYIASRIRNISDKRIRVVLQHKISTIVFEEEVNFYSS